MTFQETVRCPQCMRLGELRYQYGYYVCDYCERNFQPDCLTHWMRAFEAGRDFERHSIGVEVIVAPDGPPIVEKCDQCGTLKPDCAPEEGDGGLWCPDCIKAWEEENREHWADGQPKE